MSPGIMAPLGHDLRQTWRGLLRRPGYAGMVAATLGLGIGATTTIYSVVDAMLVRPLPYRDAQARVSGLGRAAAIERGMWLAMPDDAPPELLDVANVEAGFFDLLSVKP